MKLKMFKKIVSLASAFTIVATCLAGLNFSVSAATIPAGYEDGFEIPEPQAEFVQKVGSTIKITANGATGVKVGSKIIDFLDEENTPIGEETKWVVETTVPGKASGNALFRNQNDTGNKKNNGYSLKTVESKNLTKYGMSSMLEQTIGGFKASGQFNSVVDVRLVSQSYSPKKIITDDETGEFSYRVKDDQQVYLTFRIYINPVDVDGPVCSAKKDTDTSAKGIVFKVPTYGPTGAQVKGASLQLDEGKSFKLPFKASAGDSGLTWTSNKSECFTVVNGTVKAIKAGTGTITIGSINNPEKSVDVDVTVTPIVTAIRSNVTTLDLITNVSGTKQGDTQYVTVAPKVSTGAKVNYTVKLLKGTKGIEFTNASGAKTSYNSTAISNGGVLTFGVRTTKEFKALEKGEKIVVSAVCSEKSLATAKPIKDINIALKTTTYPDYVKNFKESVKADKVTGYREVNVTVGGKAALNLSINPITALNGFGWEECNENGEKLENPKGFATISNNGDVVVGGNVPGTCYYKAKSVGVDKDGNQVESSIYKINVYKPASSFIFEKESDSKLVVKGGYLMESDNAQKECDKKIIGGKRYTFTEPSCNASNEPIVWTSNKPGAAVFVNNGTMNLTVLANEKATYTITGTSQYTKQKYSFKVMAKDFGEDDELEDIDNGFAGIVGGKIELKKGEKYQLVPDIAGGFDSNNAKITFKPDDAKIASVSGSGVITAKAAGETPVTMSIGDIDNVVATVNVKVTENVAKPVLSVSTTSINGLKDNDVKLTVKNAPKNAEIEYFLNGNDTPIELTKGAYKIEAAFAASKEEDAEEEVVEAVENDTETYTFKVKVNGEFLDDEVVVTAYKGFMTKAPKISDTVNAYGAGAVDLATMKKNKTYNADGTVKVNGGIAAGQTFKLPIAFESKVTTGSGSEKVTTTYYNDTNITPDDIIWTASNNYIITGSKKVESPMMDKDDDDLEYNRYYDEYEFTTSPNYTGKVTLTGVTKNGGKKISLTLYVVDPANKK